MRWSYQIGRVAGIPVQVHVTLLLFLPILLLQWPPAFWVWGLIGMVALFACVALHELGHSLVAIRKGCEVRSILLLPIGGIASMTRLPSRPRDELLVAAAGPAVSFGLALLLGVARGPLERAGMAAPALLCAALSRVNFWIALFNLIPSFPMDGGRIFRAWLTPFLGRVEATRRAAKLGRTLAVVFGIWSLLFRFSLLNIAIAVFVYQAAGAEYRTILQEEALRRGYPGAGPPPVYHAERDEIVVSPPPYATRTAREPLGARLTRAMRDMFERLARY